MTLTSIALVVLVSAPRAALGVGQGAPAPAAPPDDGKREFTISGCLLRSGYAGYLVDEAKVDAIDGTPTTEPAASSASTGPAMPKKWTLEGGGNLGSRVGEKVQVIGRSDWRPPSSQDVVVDEEPPNRTPRLDVKSVKTVAPSCV